MNVTGDLPGPDATLPPDAIAIPGLRSDTLAATAAGLRLTCRSEHGPGAGTYFFLTCEGSDAAANGDYLLEVGYWTLASATDVYIRVIPLDATRPISSTATALAILPIAGLIPDQAARTWAEAGLDDPQCYIGIGCQRQFDGFWLLVLGSADGLGGSLGIHGGSIP